MDWWRNIISVILSLHPYISCTLTSYLQPYGNTKYNRPGNLGRVHPIYDGPCSRERCKTHNRECRIPRAQSRWCESQMCGQWTKKGTIEIPATDIVLVAGPWTARLASRLLGKRAGAALDIEPRFVTRFSASRSLLTARMMSPIAGAQPLSYFNPQSPSPRMPSSPNSHCLRANRSLQNSTPVQMERYICAEITQTPSVHVHFRHEQWTSRPRRTR